MRYAAQIFGLLALCASLIIYRQKKRQKLLYFKLFQDVMWLTHYLLLGTASAAATSALCITRSAVYANSHRRFFALRIWIPIYIVLYAASAVLTWSSVFSIFPALSSILSSIGFGMRQPRHTKIIALFASACTLVYNIAVAHSPSVYLGLTFTVCTSVYSLLHDERAQTPKAN